MDFELIDFSEQYYRGSADEPMPRSRGGKFVQIRNRLSGMEYIVLSLPRLSAYHGDIVERFCELNGLEGHWNQGRTLYMIEGAVWFVRGGGRWAIDSLKKVLELGSSSQAYGRFDPLGLESRILSLDSMKGYEVRIDSAN